MTKSKYTKTQLEQKVQELNNELQNPHLTKSEKLQKENAISYYINKLVEMDENELTQINA